MLSPWEDEWIRITTDHDYINDLTSFPIAFPKCIEEPTSISIPLSLSSKCFILMIAAHVLGNERVKIKL